MQKPHILSSSLIFLLAASLFNIVPADAGDMMEEHFQRPPDCAKPWAYWWWLESYVTRQGITKDLEEMKKQGINGVLIFNAGGAPGKMPMGPRFLSPQWKRLFKFAVEEAERLDMEVSINLCDGWDAGGPWITAEYANKKLVYSEMQVDGPTEFAETLPNPPLVRGYYRDIAVLAFHEKDNIPLTPVITAASRSVEGYCREENWPVDNIIDRDTNTCWRIHTEDSPEPNKPAFVQLHFHKPISVSGVYVEAANAGGPKNCQLAAAQKNGNFRTVADFELAKSCSKEVTFPSVKAEDFKLLIKSAHVPDVQIAELWLLRDNDKPYIRPGIKWWMFKSGNRSFWDWPEQGPAALNEYYPQQQGTADCRSEEVVDISEHMNDEGKLNWKAPAGRWTILRFGYTLEGQRTRCATAIASIGYEADMLNPKGIERHFNFTARPMLREVKEHVGKTLKYLHIDSYELGADVQGQQPTWSQGFRREFRARRGYDLLPYLPAMARRIVDSRHVTNRFLWDFRRTIADLMAENFFGRYAELAEEHGVQVHSETGYGTYPYPHIDGLQCAGQNHVTMGEFWHEKEVMKEFEHFGNVIRTVASAAHIYGRRIIQAEAFTSWAHFGEYPYSLKDRGDRAFCNGLNRMVFHQYTHQPRMDMKPGWQYFAGTHIDRNLTWWPFADAWFDYLARCQYLLQEGVFHADACYFYGEGSTKFVPAKQYLKPELPEGYNFDCINAEVLLNRVGVENRKIVLPSGTSYRLLVLPEEQTMSPSILSKIKQVVESGATVLGPKPVRSPGLTGYPKCDEKVRELAEQMWGKKPGPAGLKKIGRGTLAWGSPVKKIFEDANLPADLELQRNGDSGFLNWIHRVIGQADIYFLANKSEKLKKLDVIFQIAGSQPELWDPVKGQIRSLKEFKTTADGRILVPLVFYPRQSYFVVFRKPLKETSVSANNFPKISTLTEFEGPWRVSFEPDLGGPENVLFEQLQDWTKNDREGIRYYSGTATYFKTFDLPDSVLEDNKRLFLDLGVVQCIANVRLNNQSLGVVWTAPWRVEITTVIKNTSNILEIDVANLWINRLIKDASLPPNQRVTQTNIPIKANQPLRPAGLLGPVTIKVAH